MNTLTSLRHLAILGSMTLALHAAPIVTVNTHIDENDGVAVNGISLREAIDDVDDGGQILFDSSLSGEKIILQHGGFLIAGKSLAIDASSLPNGVIIDGDQITDGFTLFNDEFSNHSVTFSNLTIQNCRDSQGSAIYAIGVYATKVQLTLNDCNFIHNVSTGNGGAIHSDGRYDLNLNRCSICWNTAGEKGGGIISASVFNATNCTIACNHSGEKGAGIYFSGNVANFNHCTIYGNVSKDAIPSVIHARFDTIASFYHTICAGNPTPTITTEGSASINSSGYNILGEASPSYATATDILTNDPKLELPMRRGGNSFTCAFRPDSPACNAGDPNIILLGTPTTDQRGYPRYRDGVSGFFFDDTIDIGAYELGETITVNIALDENFTFPDTGRSLREAIAEAAANGPGTRITIDPSATDFIADLTSELVINSDLWLDGASRPNNWKISRDSSGSPFRNLSIASGKVATIEAMTLENGISPGTNVGSDGFGGGGILVNEDAHLNLIEASIIQGEASDGGSLQGGLGGGIYINEASAFILRSTISSCSSDLFGGAIFVAGKLHAANSSIINNQSSITGSGIANNSDDEILLEHCTVASNSDGNPTGGALDVIGIAPKIAFSIFANNSPHNYGPGSTSAPVSLGINLEDGNAMFNGPGDLLNTNPQLINDPAYTRVSRTPVLVPIFDQSPAIDVGPILADFQSCYGTDQIGGIRIKPGVPDPIDPQARLDLGAVEAQRRIVVDTSLDENDGPNSGEGTSLRDAIAIANAYPEPELIVLKDDLCEPIQLKAALGGELHISSSVTITGANQSAFSNEIRGPKTDEPLSRFRVMRVSGQSKVDLQYLSIANGNLDVGNGGGIHVENEASIELRNCVVKNCRAVNGGGFANSNQFGYARFISSSLFLNEASGNGGALWLIGQTSASNTTLWRNQAGGLGGAAHFLANHSNQLNGLTISENSATNGGGIYNNVLSFPLKLEDSILSGNQPNSYIGPVADGGNLLSVAHPDFTSPSTIIADPLLGPLQDNGGPTPTIAIPPLSPAVDTYTGAFTDSQRGLSPADGDQNGSSIADFGAFELGDVITVTTAIDENSAINDPNTSLREAIAAATPGTRIKFDPALNGASIILNSNLEVPPTSLIHIIGNGSHLNSLVKGGSDIEIKVHGYAEFRNLQFLENVELEITNPIGTLDFSRALVDKCHLNGGSSYSAVTVFPCCHLQIFNSTFENITSSFGPLVTNGYTTVRQCTFANNYQSSGSGVLVINGESKFDACTFRNIPSDFNGSSISPWGGDITIKQCVFDHPIGTTLIDASTYNGTVRSLGGNYSRNSESELNHHTDQIGDPKLGPLNASLGSPPIYVPKIGSPLIDAITNPPKDSLDRDPRDFRRPLDGNGDGTSLVDIGAAEAPPVILVDTEVDENDGIGNGNGTSLRDAVAFLNARNYDEKPIIGFSQHLDGLRIQLEAAHGGEILLSAAQEINASTLPNGITIAGSRSGGGGDYRVLFADAANESIQLHCLTLEEGFSNDWGGALLIENGTFFTLTDCTIRNSFAAQTGGGIAVRSSSFLGLERSTIFGNHCDQLGGGLSVENSSVQATNSTISGNHAFGGGGGMADITLSDVNFEHCTIAENTSDNGGGGLDLDQPSVRATHTILAKNFPSNLHNRSGSGGIISLGYNLDDGTNSDFVAPSDRAAVPDALIDTLDYNGGRTQTHALLFTSPAIDAGDPAFTTTGSPATDQTGFRARVQDGDYLAPDTIDIGAFELDLSTLPPDMDGDCIPNGAEVAMGFNPQDPADGLADQDGDLVSAGKEWLAGTDDNDPNSKFEMISVTDITSHQDEFEVVWSSVTNPNVTYNLELTEDGHNWIPIESGIPATGPTTLRNVPWISSTNNLFFRVSADRTWP